MARVQPFTWDEMEMLSVTENDIHVVGKTRELVIFCNSEEARKTIMQSWADRRHGAIIIPPECKFTLRPLPKRDDSQLGLQ